MEGHKGKLIIFLRSLRFKLCLGISVIGIAYIGLSNYMSYNKTKAEAQAFIDEELMQIANVIINYNVILPKNWDRPRMRRHIITDFEGHILHQFMPRNSHMNSLFMEVPSINDLFDKHQEIIIAPIFSGPGQTVYFPPNIDDGLYTVLINDKRVRAYVATNKQQIRFVVARPYELLDALVNQALQHSIGSFTLLIFIYIPCIIFIVGLIFMPVKRLASELYRRKNNDLSPITAHTLPSELDVFIEAINNLLLKTERTMQRERRFIADAAHEMRTPLTAISLQAQSLDENLLSRTEAEKLVQLRQASKRQRDLTNNLLEYARCQSRPVLHMEPLSIKDLFIEVIEDLGSIADEKDIDFGIEGECDYKVVSDRAGLKTVIRNLVSNALKYTPQGGRCDLRCILQKKRLEIIVDDSGPGILEQEKENVFNVFYRVGGDSARFEGTGLGLPIVRSTCEQLGASITLINREEGGLRACVSLPY